MMRTQTAGNRRGGNGKRNARKTARQQELDFRSWGGARKGAGRKSKGERAGVPHISRPVHKKRFPLLITSRLRPGLHSLRHEREAECIRLALAGANRAAACADGAPRDNGAASAKSAASAKGAASARRAAPFQVVHHSIQSNHLHLIVEAEDRAALTRGMRGLLVRIARGLNRLWLRRGPVFEDRFHEHELHTAREVRNALVYVLQNLRKHGIALAGPDPLSSGPEFDGWSSSSAGPSRGPAGGTRFGGDRAASGVRPKQAGSTPDRHTSGGSAAPAIISFVRAARTGVPRAKTWLLGVGWRTHGLIDPRESPRRG
jgi:REP element-mobilizing transposase RayT